MLSSLATVLSKLGVKLLSTGGTAKAIAEAGLPVTDVSDVTNFPEIMDGRVKTLHPNVHGGLLAIRDDADHVEAMKAHGIEAIDLSVINLYPFEEVRAKGGDYPTTVENIDIGGPAMIRASAKTMPMSLLLPIRLTIPIWLRPCRPMTVKRPMRCASVLPPRPMPAPPPMMR